MPIYNTVLINSNNHKYQCTSLSRGEEAGEDDQHEHEKLVVLLALLHLALSLSDRGDAGKL